MTTFVEVRREAYRETFKSARLFNPLVAEYTSPWEDGQPGAYFLSQDLSSGYVVRPDGELVLVFSMVRGRGDDIMVSAIANGATRLDCFDGYLPELYSRHGFTVTSREANWTPGEPDVVFMNRV